MRANFQAKRKNLSFFAQICPKGNLELEIHKTVGIRISMLEILVCQFSDKMHNFDFFGPNLPKNEFESWKFRNLMLE